MLTPRQLECLNWIAQYQCDTGGASPTIREISDGMGLKSGSQALTTLRALEDRGFIKRMPNRIRAIEILKMPTVPTSPSR